ncbi:MerR family transcriptional regulator [Novispirillum itersonii]|uniref:MerR family transcriptional regulator n=1 Tax=Novispirillum itersonii TaxID=189 RepID=UPI000684587F|nr:MerR family transcriptional regulator [Novispirillum itersonii]
MGYVMVQQDSRRSAKSDTAFRTISEVAEDLDVPQHVLRFWETKFTQIRPMKRGGGRRYYRPEDVTLLRRIRTLLYEDGFTIKGVQKLLRDGGLAPGEIAAQAEDVAAVASPLPPAADPVPEHAAESGADAEVEADASAEVSDEDSQQIDIFMAIEQQIAAEGLKEQQRAELAAVIEELEAVRRLFTAFSA